MSDLMKTLRPIRALRSILLAGAAMPLIGAAAQAAPVWVTIVNNGVIAPQSTPQSKTPYFFSYNQPAVNVTAQVVFRGRARPKTGGEQTRAENGNAPTHGVYIKSVGTPVRVIADNLGVQVPEPNTTGATFIEFPSTPRIDAWSSMSATRAQSTPVVTLPDGTKVGTSGVYATPGAVQSGQPVGVLVTGASQLGSIPAYSYFQVPSEPPRTKFDQFPGSPSPLANRLVTFKGNYTVNTVGKTGVFYRDLSTPTQAVQLVVKSGMPIPGGGGKLFGSAAPPSSGRDPVTGANKVVFAGFDIEAKPTAGGIFIAELGKPATLRSLVSIGAKVPGVASPETFTGFGEGLSFDGRFVSFWGSWGNQTMTVHKDCPADGNQDLLAYCRQQYPNGANLEVPVNQGIFIADSVANTVTMVTRTNDAERFTDFLYWTYSGKPPGGSDGDGDDAELPRWRSSAFSALTARAVAFKGQKLTIDGLYAKRAGVSGLIKVLDTTMDGKSVDTLAPAGSKVLTIGLERDGFRGSVLAITVSMLNAATTESWAGIYAHNCGTICSSW